MTGAGTLTDVVERSARQHPDRPALIAGDHSISFGELADAVVAGGEPAG